MAATLGGVGFMETPLVLWVQTFSAESLGYKDFFDGLVLNNCIMKQIDAKAVTDGVVADPEDLKERLHNWNTLLQNIKTYYQEVLQQLIVMKLPNIVTISRTPESGEAQAEMQRLLLLLLGCAIQCEKKELFIDNIKKLPINTQHAIVDFIKDITDDSKNVFAMELPSQHANEVTLTMHRHLCSLVDERDGYIEEIKDLNQTLEEMYQSQQVLQAQKGLVVPPAGSPEKQEKQHLIMELAESKAKARKLRQQLEEKTELASELQEEIDELKTNLSKLRNENLQLTQDARAARTYRDELDIVREKASRVDKFESEISKYKEKLNELDFYKARVEELREENTLISDAKNLLEDQLEASHRRGASVHDLENTVARCRQQLNDMTAQRDDAQERLLELMEENARLELEKRSSFNESASLEEELQQARLQVAPSGLSNSLSEQLSETANAKILRLELENQRLQKQLSEMRDSGAGENNALVLELEKENHRLARKVEHLQSDTSKSCEDYIALEQLTHELGCEKTKLLQTIETIHASSERETQELEREKEQLEHTVETLRKRNEKTHDLRLKDLETENKALDERVRESVAQLSQVTFEHRQLTKSYEQLQVSLDKMEELEQELRVAHREKEELSKSVVTMQLTCDKYEELERDHSDLEVEKMRLAKVVEGLKATIARLKTMEQDNINLTVESQQLRRSVDNMRAVANNVVDLEHERDELTAEVEQLKKALTGVKVDRSRQEELHVELMRANGANQKLQRSIEAHMQRLERTENEAADLENQNQKLSSTLEEMRVSLHRLDMLEKENADLEAENVQLQREKAGLEKEKARLGKQAESKAALLEEATETVTHLQRQNKVLQKTVTKAEDSVHRLSDVEQENVTLRQQASTERKMVSTLREDLVNEKIKTQHLSNELESISEELEKVGLNKEKIIAMEQAEDDSKYKALESMMDDAFQRTMQLKEEKICALQSRLDASRTHNQKLQEDLKAVRSQYEALQQRREEEASTGNSPNRHRPGPVAVSSTRDVFELKDHVIAVERANAALEAENNHLKSHIDDLQLRLDNTESRSVKLQMQVSSMQGQQSSQQTQLAKLQVEVTTLQSQNASLASQNAMLQKQLASLESERKELVSGQEELQSAHESLVLDHNALQHLHEQLSSEYEALISEHGSLKANHKSLRSEHKSLQEQQMLLERDRQSVNDAKKILALEQEHIQSASRSSSSLQSEFARLAEEKARLENSHKALSVDYRDEVAAHKATKTQLNQLTAKYDQLQATRSEANGQLTALEFEVSKLVSKCETMDHLNSKLEDENRTLMMQLQALLTQNQELLTQSLDSKDHFHEEQRGYLEKLAELRRQKEKLEEKIMEQYKRYDPVKRKSRGFGANLVRKAKGMMGRRSQSKDKGLVESGLHNSPENSSLGSGSVGESDGHTDSNYNKKNAAKRLPRHRRNNRSESPKLAKQNKALAKSTNALAAFRKDSTTDGFSLRGAKSSENLIDGDEFSRAGSLSSSNSSARHAEWPARQGKRRQLLGSTSGPLGYRTRQSSVSSEDTGQQDEDDMMTLDQFLSECNRSPTSRRKWLQSTGDLRGEIETEKCTTDVLSPDLGARPAVPQSEDTKHVSAAGSDASDSDHKVATRVPNSRSELNISRLSQISSPMSNKQTPVTSGGSDYAQWQPRSGGPEEVTTSTPNRYPQYTVVDVSQCMRDSARTQPTLRSVTPLSHVTENSHGRYSGRPVAASESFHNSINSTPTYLDMNPAGYHSPAEYGNSRGGVPSQQNSQMLPRQGSNASAFRRSNSMKRQPQPQQGGNGGTVRPQQQLFNSGTAVTSVRNTDAYSGVKRQMSCVTPSSSNGSNTLPKRGGSVNDRSTRYDAIYSKIPVDQGSPDVSIYATSPRRPTTPRMSNTESLDSNDSAGSYHPGNVRNLVQSYQQTVHQQVTEGPVPPPRRTRPLSAGPGSGPAFMDNSVQPHQRPYTPLVPSSDLIQRRTLPQPPDGSAVSSNRRLSSPPANDVRGQNAGSTTPRPTQRGDGPGNTPPRPQGGALEPPKNSIWSLSYHGSSTIR